MVLLQERDPKSIQVPLAVTASATHEAQETMEVCGYSEDPL